MAPHQSSPCPAFTRGWCLHSECLLCLPCPALDAGPLPSQALAQQHVVAVGGAAHPPCLPPPCSCSNAIAAPGLVQVLLHFHQSDTSSQQCLRVSLWSVALLGVALPLLILQRIGQLCQEQQQRRQGRQQEEQPPPQQARQQTPPGSLLLSLYTYSVFVWQLLLLIT